MRLNRLAIATFAVFLGAVYPTTARATGVQYGNPQAGYGQDRGGWDAPPPELQDIQRQGFHDGIIGAQKDFDNHRRFDPNNRDEYRHPNLPRFQWDAYQDGFRRGYQRGVAHLTGQDQQMPMRGPDRDFDRDRGQGPDVDVMRRGFREGMQGALRDLDNRRRPDPNNRDEYRNPGVPRELQDAYRDGYRDGYSQGMEALTGGWAHDNRGPGRDIRMRGYHDGAEGAIRDFDNSRPPDPNNRDEYRNPSVPYGMQDVYRDAFRRGYERVAGEMANYPGRR